MEVDFAPHNNLKDLPKGEPSVPVQRLLRDAQEGADHCRVPGQEEVLAAGACGAKGTTFHLLLEYKASGGHLQLVGREQMPWKEKYTYIFMQTLWSNE